MNRVIGIGGIFFKAKDPQALRQWYRDRLGLDILAWGGAVFSWKTPDAPAGGGMTVWSVSGMDSNYFAPSTAPFMVNYVVADLHALRAALQAEGCDVDERTEESEFGKFGWVMDPEGNKIELWEPPAGQ